MDYRALLKKYMRCIINREGITRRRNDERSRSGARGVC
jgi:hypothetical protein